jgi:hypothetical protein
MSGKSDGFNDVEHLIVGSREVVLFVGCFVFQRDNGCSERGL